MVAEQVNISQIAGELSSFVGLQSSSLSLIAEQSNTNGGFLTLIGLLLGLLVLLATVRVLRNTSLVLAVLLVAATVLFLSPREGQITQPVTPAKTETQPTRGNTSVREEHRPTYRVTGVSCADVLNVRMQPGLFVEGAIIGTLSCNRHDITPQGPTTRTGFSVWWLIEAGRTRGWVNSRYLSPNFDNTPSTHSAADTTQSRSPRSSFPCVPNTNASLTRDRLNSQCLVSHLSGGGNVRTYWTGTCDADRRASGPGVLRTFDVENGAMNLISMFFGEVQSGSPLVGYLSADQQLEPICSQRDALLLATAPNVRQIAKTNAIAGLNQAIALFSEQQKPAIADFYARYRRQVESSN